MKRAAIVLMVLASGCSKPAGKPFRDGGPSVFDMAIAFPPDRDFSIPPDLAPAVHCFGPGAGNSGDECTQTSDCKGTSPICILKDSMNNPWPCGYCTSTCNPLNNDFNGLDFECPGGNGTCIGTNSAGECEAACTAKSGAMPCARQGYECFAGCEPASLSQCNPTMKGACGANMSCVRIGADDVGSCTNSCSPFAQGCAPIMGMPAACFASADTGEGACSFIYRPNTDGQSCMYLNDCAAGLACHVEGNLAVCRPYCGGPNNVTCKNGKLCVDLTATVPKATVGVCGG